MDLDIWILKLGGIEEMCDGKVEKESLREGFVFDLYAVLSILFNFCLFKDSNHDCRIVRAPYSFLVLKAVV